MDFSELAMIYESRGPEGTIALLENTWVQIKGVVSSLGVGKGVFLGGEFTRFSVSISGDGSRPTGIPINPQTGQIPHPSRLSQVTCRQNKTQRNTGLWRLEESPPILPWPTGATIVIEGTFYLADHAYPTLTSCRVIDIAPAVIATP